ncbi:YggS family pyridoxal phosphate-dependent enzyme [Acetobacter thailandicus]|uniref:YggS family pyridoxal phosphate-dependent enzyme n=1 Tax=Acetobacter thailandicus TaxID=1502842 RepID=UPI001BA52A38|nr:YggS family pyridoxal phosphate-dependent enzyme [Acetobacter thailandicus]MBS0986530.1 YggS family pyridoxal phosphate-dependent enzyme [Acetobacter thailandicus]
MTTSSLLAQRLERVRSEIAAAAHKAGRNPEDVELVAVSKFHPASSIAEAIAAGQRIFGENRVQEAAAKFPALRELSPDIKLHLIGGLQTNKARDAVQLADRIESLDRPALADALAKAADACGRMPELLIEVNTGNEPQKFGIARDQADDFIRLCQKRFGEKLCGLMCIPPADEDPTLHFQLLRSMALHHGLPVLSMGMSADYPQAIAQGATHVRVGTAIFGPRPTIP